MTILLKNCNIIGAPLEPDAQGKFTQHDMVEKGILPENYKSLYNKPIFVNCNITNFKLPEEATFDHCNITPVCEESMAKLPKKSPGIENITVK